MPDADAVQRHEYRDDGQRDAGEDDRQRSEAANQRAREKPGSENPTRPFIEIRPDELVSSSAWQQASRKMSRREVCKEREPGATATGARRKPV